MKGLYLNLSRTGAEMPIIIISANIEIPGMNNMENKNPYTGKNRPEGIFPRKIPIFSGRPKRDKVISENDILNLKIALNHHKNWEDFLKSV